ncbi:MAG: DUF350 domain-containing protein [Spirochaetes bacterium]|nr:DUF350 domain-containing protein [Spirochaetota bacterium]
MEKLLSQGFETIAYTVFGMLIFGLGVWLMDKLTPFSIRKEIEDDQNTALGVVMGAVIIGLAIIIASGIAG